MRLYYHGTNVDSALSIAKQGAILSPWFKELLSLQRAVEEGKNLQLIPGETIEDLALRLASFAFATHEINHRVKCVSISRDTRIPIGHALAHGYRGNQGVVLGFELSAALVRPYDRASSTIYIPKKIPIDSLREIHTFRNLEAKNKKLLDVAFAKYKLRYVFIERSA